MTSASSLFDFSLNDQRWCKRPDLKSPQLGHMSSQCTGSGGISTIPETDETRWTNVSDPGVPDPPGCKVERLFILSPPPACTEKPKGVTSQRAKLLAHYLGGTFTSAMGLPFIPLPAAPIWISQSGNTWNLHLSENTWAGSGASLAVKLQGRTKAWGDDGSRKSPSTSAQGEYSCVCTPPPFFTASEPKWGKILTDKVAQHKC